MNPGDPHPSTSLPPPSTNTVTPANAAQVQRGMMLTPMMPMSYTTNPMGVSMYGANSGGSVVGGVGGNAGLMALPNMAGNAMQYGRMNMNYPPFGGQRMPPGMMPSYHPQYNPMPPQNINSMGQQQQQQLMAQMMQQQAQAQMMQHHQMLQMQQAKQQQMLGATTTSDGVKKVDVSSPRTVPSIPSTTYSLNATDLSGSKSWSVTEKLSILDNLPIFGHGDWVRFAEAEKKLVNEIRAFVIQTYLSCGIEYDPVTLKPRLAPEPMYHEVTIKKGATGLGINIGTRCGFTMVLGFRSFEEGVVGPAEACGKVAIGDIFAKIGDTNIFYNPLKDVIAALSTGPVDVDLKMQFMRPPRIEYLRLMALAYQTYEKGTAPEPILNLPEYNGLRGVALCDSCPPYKFRSNVVVDEKVVFTGVHEEAIDAAVGFDCALRVVRASSHEDLSKILNFPTLVFPPEFKGLPSGTIVPSAPNAILPPPETAAMGPSGTSAAAPSVPLPPSQPQVQTQSDKVQTQSVSNQPPSNTSIKAEFGPGMFNQIKAQVMVFKKLESKLSVSEVDLHSALNLEVLPPTLMHVRGMVYKASATKQPAPGVPLASSSYAARHIIAPTNKRGRRSRDDDDDDESSFKISGKVRPAPVRASSRYKDKARRKYGDYDDDVMEEDGEELQFISREKEIEKERRSSTSSIDKILAARFSDPSNTTIEYLIKWTNTSHLWVEWKHEDEIRSLEGQYGVMKVKRFLEKNPIVTLFENAQDTEYFDPSYVEIDSIVAARNTDRGYSHRTTQYGLQPTGKEFFIKWKGLGYSCCTWESESRVTIDERRIAEFVRFQNPPAINSLHEASLRDVRPPVTSWKRYETSPQFRDNENQLRSYQLEGLNWLIFNWYNRRNCILADEMGLGKTIQTVVMLEHLRVREHLRGPFLVLAPLATLNHWKREFENWTSMNCLYYHDSDSGHLGREMMQQYEFYYDRPEYQKNGIYKFNVMLTSYQTLLQDWDTLSAIEWRYIVVDEAHKVKDGMSQFSQKIKQFRMSSLLLLTGTPLQNNMAELFSLLNTIDPVSFSNYEEFYSAHGDIKEASQVLSLQETLRPYMLRRVKSDVEKTLPSKEEIVIDIELTTTQKKYYRAIFEKNRQFLGCFGVNKGVKVSQLSNIEIELRKCCNHPFLIRGVEERECPSDDMVDYINKLVSFSGKMVLLDKLLKKLSDEGHRVLIFSQFVHMLALLEVLIQARGFKSVRLDGSTSGNQRQSIIESFNKPGSDIFVFLLSTRAGGVGLNLTAADTAIIFDSDWNPQNDLQAQSRIHRIGQTRNVRIYRLVTKKSYEAEMFNRSSMKLGLSQALFETGRMQGRLFGVDEDEEKGKDIMSIMDRDRSSIDKLLKYGAYAIAEDENESEEASRKFNEADIDNILTSSRKFVYTGEAPSLNGENPTGSLASLNFSKATFESSTADSKIDYNDENFWEKVLGPKRCFVLNREITGEKFWKSTKPEYQLELLKELGGLVHDVISTRDTGVRHEDYDSVLSTVLDLTVIGKSIIVDGSDFDVMNYAKDWLEDLEKPKRNRRINPVRYFLPDTEAPAEATESENAYSRPGPLMKKKQQQPKGGAEKAKGTTAIVGKKRQSSGIVMTVTKKRKPFSSRDNRDGMDPAMFRRLSFMYSIAGVTLGGAPFPGGDDMDSESVSVSVVSGAVEGEGEDEGEGEGEVRGGGAVSMMEKPLSYPAPLVISAVVDSPHIKGVGLRNVSSSTVTDLPLTPLDDSQDNSAKEGSESEESDMWCCVCYSNEGSESDPFVICDSCGSAVHSCCYGIESIPDGENPWYCRPCERGLNPESVTCALCPLTGGAYKPIDDGRWAHVVCALWTPQIRFANLRTLEPITFIQNMKDKDSKPCSICKFVKGPCVQCDHAGCKTLFHPLCGRRNGNTLWMTDLGELKACCSAHSQRSSK